MIEIHVQTSDAEGGREKVSEPVSAQGVTPRSVLYVTHSCDCILISICIFIYALEHEHRELL
jgi:hypothetical protein